MGYVEITQEQLADCAGVVFAGASLDDVPEKMWIDYWPAGDQHYLRAVWATSASVEVAGLLLEVAGLIHRRHDVRVVSVMYAGEYSWETIEGWTMALQRVQ